MKYATNITERTPLGAFQGFFVGNLSRFLNDVFDIMVFIYALRHFQDMLFIKMLYVKVIIVMQLVCMKGSNLFCSV